MTTTLSSPSTFPAGAASISPHPTRNHFIDHHNRHVLLRGLNVSGDAKYPTLAPLIGTPEFYNPDLASYTGKPFKDAAEARFWWKKMRSWGVGVVRLVVCWEALEPKELGVYDEQYIAYLHSILKEAEAEGILVFIDGHQDVWSRFSGGSGAPLWTFHLVGLDPTTFATTHAAALDDPTVTSKYSTPSGRLWPTNYSKFAAATMFTLFFAGETFAPAAVYEGPHAEFAGKNYGFVLRTAYIRAYAHLMEGLRGLNNILGVDPMNEPHPGYINLPSLLRFNETTDLHLGHMPNALESMLLASGEPTEVGLYTRSWPQPSKRTRTDLLNPSRTSAWLPGRTDIWKHAGVYTSAASYNEKYFFREGLDFEASFYVPFLETFHAAVTQQWLFVEPVPNLGPPTYPDASTPTRKIAYSPHWYDIRTLFEKSLNPTITFDVLSLAGGSRNMLRHTYFGARGLAQNYSTNLGRLVTHLTTFRTGLPPKSPGTPVIIGETGVPWDINHLSAYNPRPTLTTQRQMLAALLAATDRSLLNYTLWNFSLTSSASRLAPPNHRSDNETGATIQSGDGWNSEDFSIASPTRGSLRPGAEGFAHPYAVATAGVLTHMQYHPNHGRWEMRFEIVDSAAEEEEARMSRVYLPGNWSGGWVRIVQEGIDGDLEGPVEGGGAGGWRWGWEVKGQGLTVGYARGMQKGGVWVVVERKC